ncbi:MAG: hypothetical protein AAGE65_10790 [Planctomycetota bacterium]
MTIDSDIESTLIKIWVRRLYHHAVEFAHRVERGDDLFSGCIGLDVVDGVENEAAVFAEDAAA